MPINKAFAKYLSIDNDLAQRCKFNFYYFVNSDSVGQDFKDWTQEELTKLLEK